MIELYASSCRGLQPRLFLALSDNEKCLPGRKGIITGDLDKVTSVVKGKDTNISGPAELETVDPAI